MKNKLLVLTSVMIASVILYAFTFSKSERKGEIDMKMNVITFLEHLGEPVPSHFISELDSVKIKQGEDLVTIGYTRKDRMNTKRISKHFVCINCHNVQPEDQNLANTDPEIRLDYMMKNKMPYLAGSTLYGVVNRTQYFNGDYEKKYGQLALNAKDTLSNAIQLCADVVSQGRELEKWEVESIMHFLHSIQLKMEDLKFSDDEVGQLMSSSKESIIQLTKSKYISAEKASFGIVQTPDIRQLGKSGDWKKGEYIFKYGCMHCHNPEGITIFTLEEDQFNRNFLSERMDNTNNRSIYEITRKGTRPKKLKKSYMPLYTYEKLTDNQLEHLAAYLNYNPKNNKK